MLKFIKKSFVIAMLSTASISLSSKLTSADQWSVPNDDAGILLSQIFELDGKEFSGSGLLKKAFLQFDEDNTSYLLQIGNRRYPVKLDDGRGVSKRAEECDKAEFMGLNPTLGCKITFDAEYNIDLADAGVEVSLTIWNVNFE